MLELNVDETLEPRVEFLRSAACVPADSIAKVLVRGPSRRTCTAAQMATRVDFLRRSGVDDAQMAKAVVAFPQVRRVQPTMRCALCCEYCRFSLYHHCPAQMSGTVASCCPGQCQDQCQAVELSVFHRCRHPC